MPEQKDQGLPEDEETLDLDSLDIGEDDDEFGASEEKTPKVASEGTVADDTSELEEELEALRKKARHADRKITEQGQENATYRQEIEALRQQMVSLQQQMQQASRPTFDNDYYDDGGNETTEQNSNDLDQYREVIPYMASQLLEIRQQLEQTTQERVSREAISAIQEATGLEATDAEVYYELQRQGDLQGAASFLAKSTIASQRKSAQRRSRDMEAASAVVTGTSSQSTGSAEDPFGGVTDPAARRAMLAEDPSLLTKAARAMRRRR